MQRYCVSYYAGKDINNKFSGSPSLAYSWTHSIVPLLQKAGLYDLFFNERRKFVTERNICPTIDGDLGARPPTEEEEEEEDDGSRSNPLKKVRGWDNGTHHVVN